MPITEIASWKDKHKKTITKVIKPEINNPCKLSDPNESTGSSFKPKFKEVAVKALKAKIAAKIKLNCNENI